MVDEPRSTRFYHNYDPEGVVVYRSCNRCTTRHLSNFATRIRHASTGKIFEVNINVKSTAALPLPRKMVAVPRERQLHRGRWPRKSVAVGNAHGARKNARRAGVFTWWRWGELNSRLASLPTTRLQAYPVWSLGPPVRNGTNPANQPQVQFGRAVRGPAGSA